MITEEELKDIKEKLYDNEKYPYINCRLTAKKLFEELVLMRANSAPPKEEKPKNYEEPMYVSVEMNLYSFHIYKIVLYGLEQHPAGQEGRMCLTKIESIDSSKISEEIIVVKAWSEMTEPASVVSIDLSMKQFNKIILMGFQRYFGNSVYTVTCVGVFNLVDSILSSYVLKVILRGELDKTDQEKSTSQILEMAYPELSQEDRNNKLNAELDKIKGDEVSQSEFRDNIKERHIGKEWEEWDSGLTGVVGHLGKEGEAGKSPQQYIVELERAMLDDSECNLAIQKYQKEYIEQLLRIIDNNNEFNEKITVCNQELQFYHGLLEMLVERYEKAILEHKEEVTQHCKNLEMITETNEKLWSAIYNTEIVRAKIIRSQTVTKELEKENADLKVKLKMALELLSAREQMLVNLEESNIVL
jgi:hypothetical protein